jgi:hypothetical protein
MIQDPILVDRLARLADAQNQSIEGLLQQWVTSAEELLTTDNELESFIGIFDDDITDLSTTVSESLKAHFKGKV